MSPLSHEDRASSSLTKIVQMGLIGPGRRIETRMERSHFVLDPEADQSRATCCDEFIQCSRSPPQGQYVGDEELAQDMDDELIGQE